MAELNRRSFLAGAGCTCAVGLQGCGALHFVQADLQGQQLVLDALVFNEHTCVGINHPRLREPLALSKLKSGEYAAVSAICTHKKCELRFANNQLECPCHGSSFSLTGEVQNPPARENLQRFSVKEINGKIYIGA